MSAGTNQERLEQNNELLEDIKTQIQDLPEGLNTQEKEIEPSIELQEIVPDEDYNALSKVTVQPVTASIDSSIVADNILRKKTILGVEGTLPAVFKVQGSSNLPTNNKFRPNQMSNIDVGLVGREVFAETPKGMYDCTESILINDQNTGATPYYYNLLQLKEQGLEKKYEASETNYIDIHIDDEDSDNIKADITIANEWYIITLYYDQASYDGSHQGALKLTRVYLNDLEAEVEEDYTYSEIKDSEFSSDYISWFAGWTHIDYIWIDLNDYRSDNYNEEDLLTILDAFKIFFEFHDLYDLYKVNQWDSWDIVAKNSRRCTATAKDVRAGKTVSVNNEIITGTLDITSDNLEFDEFTDYTNCLDLVQELLGIGEPGPLQYINNPEGKFISLNYVPNINTKIEVVCEIPTANIYYGVIYGACSHGFEENANVLFGYMNRTNFCYNRSGDETSEAGIYDKQVTITTLGDTCTYTDGEITKTIISEGTLDDCVCHLTVFAKNNAENISYYDISNECDFKLYGIKIWEGDTLIMECVPYRNEAGQKGLMNITNNEFYGFQVSDYNPWDW